MEITIGYLDDMGFTRYRNFQNHLFKEINDIIITIEKSTNWITIERQGEEIVLGECTSVESLEALLKGLEGIKS